MKKYKALNTVLDLALARTIVVRDMERRLSSHGIGLSDLALVLELYEATDLRAQRIELAERLGVTPSGLARQLLPLERIGLVSRVSDASDARKAHVVLTNAGRSTVEDLLPEAEDSAAAALSKRWSVKELTALASTLAKIR